jgi:hypothetical protein
MMFDSPEGPKQKGLKRIARERGVPNWNSSKEVLVAIANTWPDFQNIKPLLVEEVEACGPNFIIKFLPKFHCELNPIEMVRFALMWQRSLLCLLGSLLVMNCCLFLSLVWQLWGGAKRLLRHVLDGKFATLRKHLDAYLCQVGRNMSYVGNWFGHVQKFIDAYALGSSLGTATASVKKSHRCASRAFHVLWGGHPQPALVIDGVDVPPAPPVDDEFEDDDDHEGDHDPDENVDIDVADGDVDDDGEPLPLLVALARSPTDDGSELDIEA